MPDIRRLDSATGPRVVVLHITGLGYARVKSIARGFTFETTADRLHPDK
ncbi:hypothetical protein [Hymenobacter busanensis]|nr:hypothetical protein [Hymenobacter busanensis]QHJ07898.1 hypothetical protein GUY19_11645 [Hymenobacter busanensis]